MARQVVTSVLNTPPKRLELVVDKQTLEGLHQGAYLVYRRAAANKPGAWAARRMDPVTKKPCQRKLGHADDYREPNGITILSYDQAVKAALSWCEDFDPKILASRAGAKVVCVSDVMADYLAWGKRTGMKGLKNTTANVNAHILPVLGDTLISLLTKQQIEDWMAALAASSKRRVKKTADNDGTPRTEEEIRQRKDTANRIFTSLRAALNQYGEAHPEIPMPWKQVKTFQGTEEARVRFLTIDEQQKLVAACEGDFKRLVQAALFTGCRYQELNRLQVKEFDPRACTLYIKPGKSGKSRFVPVAEEGLEFFRQQVKDPIQLSALTMLMVQDPDPAFKKVMATKIKNLPSRSGEARMLPRNGIVRTKRLGVIDEDAWADSDQTGLMDRAYAKAGIEPVSFHELRHTFASGLVTNGMPLIQVAAVLGHSDTKMVEKYYAHLRPEGQIEAVRKYMPVLGITDRPKALDGFQETQEFGLEQDRAAADVLGNQCAALEQPEDRRSPDPEIDRGLLDREDVLVGKLRRGRLGHEDLRGRRGKDLNDLTTGHVDLHRDDSQGDAKTPQRTEQHAAPEPQVLLVKGGGARTSESLNGLQTHITVEASELPKGITRDLKRPNLKSSVSVGRSLNPIIVTPQPQDPE